MIVSAVHNLSAPSTIVGTLISTSKKNGYFKQMLQISNYSLLTVDIEIYLVVFLGGFTLPPLRIRVVTE